MKFFAFLLILFLNFQSLSKADNINEIEIEQLSLGSSLLDHFSKDEIEVFRENSTMYKENKFEVIFVSKELENFDRLQVTIKPNDKRYIIYSINGILDFDNKFNECKKKSSEILSDIKSVLDNFREISDESKFEADPSGETITSGTWLWFDSGGYIGVACTDFGETMLQENGWTDELSVDITSEEFDNFLRYEAYK